jgi:hypothetical protein
MTLRRAAAQPHASPEPNLSTRLARVWLEARMDEFLHSLLRNAPTLNARRPRTVTPLRDT